jgi:predicted small lipoprotein YifL
MIRFFVGLVALFSIFAIAGCGTSGSDSAPKASAASEEMTVEVGCFGCIYNGEGAAGCQTAAKVGDTAMLVEGVDFSAHNNGLCEEAKQAKISGKVEGDILVADSIAIVE